MTVLGLAWPTLREAMRRWRMHEALARVAVSLCFIVGVFELSISGARFASGAWRVPLDCDFTVLPGKTMPETYRYLLAHPDAVDHNYEPERTWTVLHFLSRNARDDDTFSHAAIAKRLQR